MHNTLRCRPDFCEQKCKLEEVCESEGAKFHLLPICHPELNPIEGENKHSHHNYYHINCHLNLNLFLQTIGTVRKG
jgi:transposase